MTSKNSEAIRASVQQFIQERKYLLNVSPKTLIFYGCAFKAFEGALETEKDVKEQIPVLRERGVGAISVNTYLTCIQAYFTWRGEKVKFPHLKVEQKILITLSDTQIRSLVKFAPGKSVNTNRSYVLALLLLDSGLRISEALSLRKEDIDLEQSFLRIMGKGGKHRLVPLSQELRNRLYRYMRLHEQHYLFETRSGRKVSVRNIQRDFKALFKQVGIEGIRTSPHTLRHSFAVGYLRNGGNLEFLRRILGHSSILTTQKYLRSLGVEDLSKVHNNLTLLNQMK